MDVSLGLWSGDPSVLKAIKELLPDMDVWIREQLLKGEPISLSTIAALKRSGNLKGCIISPFYRPLPVLAASALTLSEISESFNVVLWGTRKNSGLLNHAVNLLRQLLSGEEVVESEYFHLKGVKLRNQGDLSISVLSDSGVVTSDLWDGVLYDIPFVEKLLHGVKITESSARTTRRLWIDVLVDKNYLNEDIIGRAMTKLMSYSEKIVQFLALADVLHTMSNYELDKSSYSISDILDRRIVQALFPSLGDVTDMIEDLRERFDEVILAPFPLFSENNEKLVEVCDGVRN
jgi:hypothetical protein